ncbi:MAG: 2-oxoacid:acceptor oxidoreductase family protein [Coriobacteriia bacterium]|nr:2-oxoacid:acceptor oxidoreductase family protein [Coriobacteriia bacterium]MBS5478558.1 2-oxoacid:acceptor oxidoreductase family protein [Coriobacteriia bacterium]
MASIKIVLAGFGGQGVLFAGKLIANTALIEDREVSWLPSYGPEMRGGTANCSVTIADEPIGSPLVTAPDALVAMNQPSLEKFMHAVEPGGLILADTTLVATLPETSELAEGVRVIGIPASTMAEEGGLKGLANIILVGKLWEQTKFCSREALDAALAGCVPPRKAHLLEPNKRALQLGIDA